MVQALIVSISLAATVNASQTTSQRTVAMQELTVPSERLPVGCALSPAPSVQVGASRVRSGLWAGFPTNPWIGTDRKLVAAIREAIDGPSRVPDGAPLDARALSRYLGKLADGVEQAYGAVYLNSGGDLIIVRALKFAPGLGPPPESEDMRGLKTLRVIRLGPIAAIVTGEGECFQAASDYLNSLAH